jgi:serralysin
VHELDGGDSLTSIAGEFLTSPEGQGIYCTAVGSSASANATFVNTLYQEIFGRASDPIGAQDWTNALNAGVLTPAQELVGFIQSPEAQARDATPVTNFLLAAGNGTANYSGNLFEVRDPATSLVVNQHDLA